MKVIAKALDDTDKKIIEHITAGRTYKEIAARLSTKAPHIRYRIQLMKREYGCQSIPHLIAHIYELKSAS